MIHGSTLSSVASFALVAVLSALTSLADASLPDPSWMSGVYDDNDFDDIVGFITSGAAWSMTSPPGILGRQGSSVPKSRKHLNCSSVPWRPFRSSSARSSCLLERDAFCGRCGHRSSDPRASQAGDKPTSERSLNPCPQDKVIDKISGKSTGVARTKLASGSREDSENDLRRVFRST
jgi:hypothetical protein